MLDVEGLAVSHGKVPAVFDVSLHMDPGEAVALLGANGAGKTSTLMAISGIVRSRSGRILFEGQDISRSRSHTLVERGIVHCPEARHLFRNLTVQENLELGALSRRARPGKAGRLDEVYGLFPRLAERRRQRGGSLSGGEQQMCALGRALMGSPTLLLLDEPSLGLAPKIVAQVFAAIREIRRTGATVLLVEQNVKQSLQIVDRAYVIERGRTVASGTAADLVADEHLRRAYLGL